MDKDTEKSVSEYGKKIVGKRNAWAGTIILPLPDDIQYHCPVCKYEANIDGKIDERLRWGDFNGFIWCSVCKVEYPSTLCCTDIKKATDVYLECVANAIKLWTPTAS